MRSRFQKKLTSLAAEEENKANNNCWCPRISSVFNLLLSARITAAFLSTITDCDETFNYWEPTHHLLYGEGFQTWEYSPTYALRSYAYILLHSAPAGVVKHIFNANKITVFYYVRFLLGILCAACETYFYKSVCTQFGNHVGRLYFFMAVLSSGMFISATAYLPSSFAMYATLIAFGGWFNQNYTVAVFGIAIGALLGWPFFALAGLPIAFDIVFRQHRFWMFVKISFGMLAAIMLPVIAIDQHFYGKQVIAPLNIILYNVFGQGGPNLYGEEPFIFYFINGFLNFNFAFFMALASLPLNLLTRVIVKKSQDRFRLPIWLASSAMYLWLLVFFTRPHKEERFLFPVYPLILLAACFALSNLQELYHAVFTKEKLTQHFSTSSNWFACLVILTTSILSLSRISAIHFGYRAPLDLYPELHNLVNPFDSEQPTMFTADERINVCVGREWYRYPSSFFLPDNWRFLFIKSEFKGQLPQPYASGPHATKVIPDNTNDLNKEEPGAYSSIEDCDLLVDIDLATESDHERNYSQQTDKWKILRSQKFLDANRSSRLFRAFYIPFVSSHYTTYVDYNLLIKTKKKKKKRSH